MSIKFLSFLFSACKVTKFFLLLQGQIKFLSVMRCFILYTLFMCSLCVNAQSYDINEDGEVNVADVSSLVKGVLNGGKGKLYYSKDEVDQLLKSVNARLSILEKKAGISYPCTPTASFKRASVSIKIGDTFSYKVSTNSDGAITYTSSSPSIVSVDESTGDITALSNGSATITATITGTAYFSSISASYSVSTLDKKYNGYTTPSVVDLGLQVCSRLNL